MTENKFQTDTGGKPVHPRVTEMAEQLAELNGTHLVLINWWKTGHIQYWYTKKYIPEDVYDFVQNSNWRVKLSETRVESGKERGYAEFKPTEFDPSEFPDSPQ